MNKVILFDGECNFCDRSVQFIINRDPTGYYKFASLQSSIGKSILKRFNISSNLDGLLFIDDNKCYSKSSAALRICRNLTGFWKLLYIFIIIPKPIRDIFYSFVAKNRYKWFGKKDRCRLLTPSEQERFL